MSIHQGGAIGYGEAQQIADDVDAALRPWGGGVVGRGCLAMVTNDPLKLMFKIGERVEKFPLEPVDSGLPWADAQVDGMGPNYIVYWPGIELEGECEHLAGDDRPRSEDVRHSGVGAPGWGW